MVEAGDQGLQPEGHETHAGKTGVGRQTSPRNRATHEWGHGMDDVGAPECEVHTAEGAKGTGGGAGVRDGALVGTKNDAAWEELYMDCPEMFDSTRQNAN